MDKLLTYLSTLNTMESNYAVFVDPKNFDNYRIETWNWDGGHKWIKMGNLDNLSFGFQVERDAFQTILDMDLFLFNLDVSDDFNKNDFEDVDELYEKYLAGNLLNQDEIEEAVRDLMATWSSEAAWNAIEQLKEYIQNKWQDDLLLQEAELKEYNSDQKAWC